MFPKKKHIITYTIAVSIQNRLCLGRLWPQTKSRNNIMYGKDCIYIKACPMWKNNKQIITVE